MAFRRKIYVTTRNSTYTFHQVKDDSGNVSTYVTGGTFGNHTYMCTVLPPQVGHSCHIYIIKKLDPCTDEKGLCNGSFMMRTDHYPTSKILQILQQPFEEFRFDDESTY